MLSSDWTKKQNEAQADPAKTQARKMLRMLCKFMLPVIQSASGQRMDPETVVCEIEADEFVKELEIFISGIISRSEPRKQDIAIETALWKELFPHQKDKVRKRASSDDEGGARNIATSQSMIPHHPVPPPVHLDTTEKALGENLQYLRKSVTQNMPIRLLCFEPHNSKLKISLLERADVYNYLATKLRADFSKNPHMRVDSGKWQHDGYAILSHTWNEMPGELTYHDWKNGSLDATQPKCQKLVNFCKAAWENHGQTLGWIDTVCINKESSAELDESIRSMYAWYRDAEICITYLAATNAISDMRNDPWFTRGWTLQELLAPSRIKFYNTDWMRLAASADDKFDLSIRAEIKSATTITWVELENFHQMPISRRMQLAANRQVTRGEDMAYCLMGIFDVSISTAYGEGAERAFFRLVEEIFRSTKDVSDLFNWARGREGFSREPTSSLFPSHPSNYLNRSTNEQLRPWRPIEPLTLTHLGLRTPILLMPAIPALGKARRFPYPPPFGDYHAAVSVDECRAGVEPFNAKGVLQKFLLLDERIYGSKAVHEIRMVDIPLAFGTLNVEERGTSICVPKTCFAVLLFKKERASPAYSKRAYTANPIIFDLKKIRQNSDSEGTECYLIERSKLANHGMHLVTLYL